jgi:hypothetical protein
MSLNSLGKIISILELQKGEGKARLYKHLQVDWAKEGEMSKLVRVPIGLNVDLKDADEFLVEKL